MAERPIPKNWDKETRKAHSLPMLPVPAYAFWALLFVAVAGFAVAIWVW